jgi:hypothetical protein
MKLADLHPKYVQLDGVKTLRFDCPKCWADPDACHHCVRIVAEGVWTITGELPDITVTPSIQSDDPNCMLHIFITNGEIIGC